MGYRHMMGGDGSGLALSGYAACRSSGHSLVQQYVSLVLPCAIDDAKHWGYSTEQHREAPYCHGTCILEGGGWAANKQVNR